MDAPDAWVLLSDAFLDGHCFTLRDGGQQHPDLIGLEFRPVRQSSLVDVEGVLWLDRASAMLRAVDYRFVGLPRYIPAGRFRGRVEFERGLLRVRTGEDGRAPADVSVHLGEPR